MMKFKTIPRKLRVFDFDDTLVKTDAKIKILNKNLALSTHEFTKYKQEDTDEFDFSDFRNNKLINPQPTEFLKTAFLNIVGGEADIMILTARPETEIIKTFLSKYVDPERLIIIGSAGTPELKKQEIKKVLDDYNDIKFFDDSVANINAVKSLNSPKISTQIVRK